MTVRGTEAASANNSGASQPAAGTPTDFAVSAQALTQGDWEIRELLGLSGDRSWVYFTAVDQDSLQQHLYRVPIGGGDRQKVTVQAGSHDVRLSDTGNFYIDTVSAWHVPPAVMVCRSDGEPTHILAPSWDDALRYYRLARPQRVRYTARDGTLLDGVLLVPPDFDSTGTKKYPVLCYVYGGPQAPVVRDRWGGRTAYLWHQMLAQQGICVWISDNRAATYRGMRYTWPIHGRLGELELQDLEDGVAWLSSQPWVDEQRIGIWGWSYGGYLTAYALTHSRRFRLGIAGAPVTDWRNYDAIYTERLMNTPQDNPDGYRRSSLVRAASQLHGHLVLIHGDADDNVHLANTLQLAEALQRAGKPFTMMIYPRNGHGVTQPEQYRHLQRMMTDWITQWLLH
jgi:dipeptidyl-peptidase-4